MDLEVEAVDNTTYTVAMKPNNCATNLPLLEVAFTNM